MTPVNQGSKAALITWTVIATVFGITMAVLALIAYVNSNEIQVQSDSRQQQFTEFASEADLQSAEMSELKAAVKDPQQGGANVYALLVNRQQQLAKAATGATRFEQADEAMKASLAQTNARAGINASTLTGALEQLHAQLAAVRRENETLRQEQQSLQARIESEQQNAQQMLAQKDQAITQAAQELQEVQAEIASIQEQFQMLSDDTSSNVDTLRVEWEDKLRSAEDRITSLTRSLETAGERLKVLTQRNRERWQFDQMMASPDGRVLRSPIQGQLFVDIGRNHGISNGMTFEVYDPVTGIPRVESEEATDLPIGKGSIQIIQVDPNSSVARVVNQRAGQTIREGDIVANLAFDKNVPVRFRVYGDFDLDNDGTPSPVDYNRVLTLIREFGGRVVEDVTVNTDVLVMGQEPVVPRVTEAELADPEKNRQWQQAVELRERYMAVRNQAKELNIPILNQNQFLYYIGYFDQANR